MPVTLPTLPARKTLRPAQAAQQLPPLKSPRVLGQLRERLRFLHYSPRTEEVYVYWVKAFIRFHGLRHHADFWVFPQNHHSADPATSVVRRHHLYDQTFQRAFKRAAQAPGVAATMI